MGNVIITFINECGFAF